MILLTSKVTSKLKRSDISSILKLKNQEWNYGLISQKNWFKQNIKSKDIHVLLFYNNKIAGYTCLRKRTYRISKKNYRYLLFDTLIIEKKLRSKGLGKLLMIFNNNIIKKNKLPSFLVCRKKTIKFYKSNYWKHLNNKYFKIIDNKYPNQYSMIYNEQKFVKLNKLLLWVKK